MERSNDSYRLGFEMKTSLIESIKANEGFEPKPYPDPLHGWSVPTFGHGLTYITEAESVVTVTYSLVRFSKGDIDTNVWIELCTPLNSEMLIPLYFLKELANFKEVSRSGIWSM
jgi:hypothetical protein